VIEKVVCFSYHVSVLHARDKGHLHFSPKNNLKEHT
jgi:hypothetical protein